MAHVASPINREERHPSGCYRERSYHPPRALPQWPTAPCSVQMSFGTPRVLAVASDQPKTPKTPEDTGVVASISNLLLRQLGFGDVTPVSLNWTISLRPAKLEKWEGNAGSLSILATSGDQWET